MDFSGVSQETAKQSQNKTQSAELRTPVTFGAAKSCRLQMKRSLLYIALPLAKNSRKKNFPRKQKPIFFD